MVDLTRIHLVEPVQDLLGKQGGTHTFDKKSAQLNLYLRSIHIHRPP